MHYKIHYEYAQLHTVIVHYKYTLRGNCCSCSNSTEVVFNRTSDVMNIKIDGVICEYIFH